MSRNFELLRKAKKEQDLFAEDVVARATQVAHLHRAEEEQDLFQPSSRATTPTDHSISPQPTPRVHSREQTITPLIKILHLLLGPLAQLRARKMSQRPTFRRRVIRKVSKPRSRRSGILAQASLIQEEEIKLVQRVFLLPGTGAPRTVVFSSVERGNGCSWVCARASENLAAQVTGSVCVVDANLRSPFLHHYFGLVNRRGLTEAVLQSGPLRSYAQQLPGGNLWVLTSGSPPSDPHVLLTSEALRSRMTELRTAFDYVLIDAPPVSPYTDASLLGQLADGVVLVLEANSTRRETAREAKQSLEAANSRVLAAVLNKRTFPLPDFIYHNL
jgi:capsular exopolysaccharide synthesis family protein